MIKDENKFNFFIPAEITKGGKDGKQMFIKGIASSETEDSDGETLVPSGYDLTPLLESGFLNYNHKSASDPDAIIGEPTKAEIINDGKDLYIEGFLYPNSTAAQKTYQLAQVLEKDSPNRRMGFSIEGKALEKDPLNPLRITKARITGVAITPQPKNPNTLLSIMKGEYAELFVDSEDEDEKEAEEIDKAMTASAAEGVTQTEDVDGGKAAFDKLQRDKILKKSEVYSLIISRYSDYMGNDIQKAKQIYNLIQELNTKKYGMENTNGEILSKALEDSFSFLDEQISKIEKGENTSDIEKSENNASQEENKEEVIKKSENSDELKDDSDKEVDDKDSKEEKKDDDKKESSDDEEIKKSENDNGIDAFFKSLIKEQLEKGISSEAIINDLTSKGINSVFATKSVEGVISEMSNLEANGDISENGLAPTQETPAESTHSSISSSNPISKSESNDLDIIKSEITSAFRNEQNTLVEQLEIRFNALGNILKSQSDQLNSQNETLVNIKQENTELKKSLVEAKNSITNFASQPQRVRTVTSPSQIVERFNNGIQKSETGKEILSLSKAEDVSFLTQKLDQQFDLQKSQGGDTRVLGDAVFELSVSKTLDKRTLNNIQSTLNALNIELVQ